MTNNVLGVFFVDKDGCLYDGRHGELLSLETLEELRIVLDCTLEHYRKKGHTQEQVSDTLGKKLKIQIST
jgi:hypothetical protein